MVLGHDDGDVDGKQLQEQWIPVCQELGIWETLAPRVAVAARRVRPQVRIYADEPGGAPQATATAPERVKANPRDVNLVYRAQVHQAARWMSVHIGHDGTYATVGAFQTAANKAAGIPFDSKGKGMRDLATPGQLRAAALWMRAEIAKHCDAADCRPPAWLSEPDNAGEA